MISISQTVDNDILLAYRDLIAQLPKVAPKAFKGTVERHAKNMQRELSTEPGRPTYPLRWKSAKQRRYVMRKLRSENNLPYQRTHELAKNWRVITDFKKDIMTVIAENRTKSAVFVQGDYAQPFHLDTGWPQSAPIYIKYQELMTDDLIQTWYALTDFASKS